MKHGQFRMDESTHEPPIFIRDAESKKALAVFAHLRRLLETVTREDKILRPIQMDHADLLLCSASIRALLFDDDPILLSFSRMHELNIEIECLETNIALMLLSWLVPDDLHVSDFLMDVLLNPEMRGSIPLDQESQTVHTFRDGAGWEAVLKRPDLWVPDLRTEKGIDSGIGLSNLGSPAQLMSIRRRRVPLADWGKVRLGYLKDIAITRQSLLTYVANKLGGVHYESTRLPPNRDDAAQFKVLATAYDWDNKAIMHAGLVAVAIARYELINVPLIVRLYFGLEKFHLERQRRLMQDKQSEQ
jgi:hypothetical protein